MAAALRVFVRDDDRVAMVGQKVHVVTCPRSWFPQRRPAPVTVGLEIAQSLFVASVIYAAQSNPQVRDVEQYLTKAEDICLKRSELRASILPLTCRLLEMHASSSKNGLKEYLAPSLRIIN